MRPFRIILFAADFSKNSRDAFRSACSLAAEGEARLHVLHVVEPHLVPDEPAGFSHASDPLDHTVSDGGREENWKRRMREAYTPGHPIELEYHVRDGDASVEILRMADEIGADLIAMGTHGRAGLSTLLAGSVATTVLRKAHCPVLALRSKDRPHPAEQMRVILHPTDFSDASEAALRVARSLARDLGTRLIVLHVRPFDVYLEGKMAPELDPPDDQHSLEMIRQRVDGPDLKYPVEALLSRGFEAAEILRVAQERECDLIVIGTHGRTILGRLLMGSTAESVLLKAGCPVLVVKSARGVPVSTKGRLDRESQTVIGVPSGRRGPEGCRGRELEGVVVQPHEPAPDVPS